MKTYGELKTAVGQYLYDRKDLANIIDTFVALSERRIFRLLRCPANEALHLVEDLEINRITLPRDYLECKLMTADDRQMGRISDQEYLLRSHSQGAESEPQAFARIGSELLLWPPPAEPVTVKLVYWQDLSGQLVSDSDTNDILRIAPDLYVYGALLEAMPYLAQDERTETWNSLFDQALAQVN